MKTLQESILDADFDIKIPKFKFRGVTELLDILNQIHNKPTQVDKYTEPEIKLPDDSFPEKLHDWADRFCKHGGSGDYLAYYIPPSNKFYFINDKSTTGTKLLGFDDERVWYLDHCIFYKTYRDADIYKCNQELWKFLEWYMLKKMKIN